MPKIAKEGVRQRANFIARTPRKRQRAASAVHHSQDAFNKDGSRKLPRGRPSAKQAAERADKLLAVALAEFLRCGFEGADINKIARKAGVSRITLYRQFGDKEALFRDVYGRAVEQMTYLFEHVQTAGRDPLDVIADFALASSRLTQDKTFMALIRLTIGEGLRFPEISRAILRAGDRAMQPLKHYLDELVEQGIIKQCDTSAAAVDMLSLCHGGLNLMLYKPHRFKPDRQKSLAIATMFLYGLAGQRRRG